MRSSQTVVMLVEIHHLEPVELVRDSLDFLLLAWLLYLDAICVPAQVKLLSIWYGLIASFTEPLQRDATADQRTIECIDLEPVYPHHWPLQCHWPFHRYARSVGQDAT